MHQPDENDIDADMECPDCYGVGAIDNRTLVPDLCFPCSGTGRVPNPFAPD